MTLISLPVPRNTSVSQHPWQKGILLTGGNSVHLSSAFHFWLLLKPHVYDCLGVTPMQHSASSQGHKIMLSSAIPADLLLPLVWGRSPQGRNSKDLVASNKGHQTSATSGSPHATGKRNSNNPQIHKDRKLP